MSQRVRRLTVKDYYKHFLSVYGVLAAAVAGFPMLSKLLPDNWAAYFFPPLGDQSPPVRAAALVLGAAVTLVVTKRGRMWVLVAPLALAAAGLLAFFVLSQLFVRSLPIPGGDAEVVVSVGYERTPYALSRFPEATDWELLRQRGPTEEEIERLWTPGSVVKARLGLYLSYLTFLLSAVAVGSLGVLFDRLGPPPDA
jgi:hypothetical protein